MIRGTHTGTRVDTHLLPGHTRLHKAIRLLQVGTRLKGILPKGILPKGTRHKGTHLPGTDIHRLDTRLHMVAILLLITQEPVHLILVC